MEVSFVVRYQCSELCMFHVFDSITVKMYPIDLLILVFVQKLFLNSWCKTCDKIFNEFANVQYKMCVLPCCKSNSRVVWLLSISKYYKSSLIPFATPEHQTPYSYLPRTFPAM